MILFYMRVRLRLEIVFILNHYILKPNYLLFIILFYYLVCVLLFLNLHRILLFLQTNTILNQIVKKFKTNTTS